MQGASIGGARRLGLVLAAAAGLLVGCEGRRTELPVLPVGGDFTLTGSDGQPFSLTAERGKVVLIFFGYLSCPDACPTTLSKLTSVYRKLGDDAARVKIVYVSVDPARDTPEALAADLGHFRLDALGLTGSKAEIDAVVKAYGAAYEVIQTPESAGRYTVSHATRVYGLDPQGRVRVLFDYDATVDQIVDGIHALLAAG